MNIEKLPSGSYRIRQTYKGQKYSVTIPHKPSKKEAIQLLAEVMEDATPSGSMEDYCNKYIDSKDAVLSPATVRGYLSIIRNMTKDFKRMQLRDITASDIQIEVSTYAVTRSAKSTENFYGFISSVLGLYRPNFKYTVTLPMKVEFEPYIPTDEEVKAVLDYAKGSRYEVALWLGVHGLRRSEICALTLDDLTDDNRISITKAKVLQDKKRATEGRYIIKELPKTKDGRRTITILPKVADMIRENGDIYIGEDPNNILKYLHRVQEKLALPAFRLHDLRHYFATVMSEQYPEADVMEFGGWSSDAIMKKIYRHSRLMQNKKEQSEAVQNIFKNLQ